MFCVCLPPLQEIAHRYQPHSLQAELCSTLQQCSEAGEEARQRELAAAVMDVQLGRREALLEGLMELSGQLAATLQRYKSLVEGRGICVQSQSCGPSCDGLSLSLSDHAVPLPPSLPAVQPLLDQHTTLSQRISTERQMPSMSKKFQVSKIKSSAVEK